MKLYCFQFSTGMVFRTPQDIVFTSEGYAIDRQGVTDDELPINGRLHINNAPGIPVTDMTFRSSNIVASWIE